MFEKRKGKWSVRTKKKKKKWKGRAKRRRWRWMGEMGMIGFRKWSVRRNGKDALREEDGDWIRD